jgi:tellurite resistance protein TehA-like permease
MTGAGVAVLLFGALIVAVEGALVARGGWEFLTRVYPDPKQAKGVAFLLLAPGGLLIIGVLVLLSVVGMGPDDGLRTVLARLGLVFLLAAGVHVMVMMTLKDEEEEVEELEEAEEAIGRGRPGRGKKSPLLLGLLPEPRSQAPPELGPMP